MPRKRDRRHDNPGRPVVIGATEAVRIRLAPKLLADARAAARREHKTAASWWRDAGMRAVAAHLSRQIAAGLMCPSCCGEQYHAPECEVGHGAPFVPNIGS